MLSMHEKVNVVCNDEDVVCKEKGSSSTNVSSKRKRCDDATSMKLWTDRKPTLNYLHVWGCPTETRLFNPSIGKLDPKTVSCHFIGYPDKSKGFVSTVLIDTSRSWKLDTLFF
jgi:hypothetical protein